MAYLRGITVLFLDGNPEQILLFTVTLKMMKMVPEIMKAQVSESEMQTEMKEPTIVLNQNIQTDPIELEEEAIKLEYQSIGTNTEEIVVELKGLEGIMQNAVEKAINARRPVLNKGVTHEIEDPKTTRNKQLPIIVKFDVGFWILDIERFRRQHVNYRRRLNVIFIKWHPRRTKPIPD
ncbi:hypothetical protein WR25_20963 [Diploscapter pachys]|uniref:Uncharacterized protein n=1 Tax=Diploscapter pachys TaxID=2018661 RepID=A0A2A2JX17_9BILA|nr:hypothetical protein WR25_20963 [Diploscapter pachys]